LKHFQEAAKLAPEGERTHYYLGMTFHKLGQFENAERALERALELDANDDRREN